MLPTVPAERTSDFTIVIKTVSEAVCGYPAFDICFLYCWRIIYCYGDSFNKYSDGAF